MATPAQVKELRRLTGCGIVECSEALKEAGDDIEQAITLLRKKGVVKAAKKADRDTFEGIIASYVHTNGKIAVLVTLLCETDFVARNEVFQELAKNIALHIAAMAPLVVSPDDVGAAELAVERDIALEQAKNSGKPAEIQEKIVEGKLQAFRKERALLTQPFVKEPAKTIEQLIYVAIQELGENITVKEFARLSI